MPQSCPKCGRSNPPEAVYCYFDGKVLRAAAPAVDPVTRVFPTPFALTAAVPCHTFRELTLALHRDPAAAWEALRHGRLEAFLQAQGRPDLARAAREAARAPDPDRGLDDFLGKLPGNALTPAHLRIEPKQIDLGEVRVGRERRFLLALHNAGGMLLHGTVTSECPWLVLGDSPGVRQKLFQFHDQLHLLVQVVGASLRAFRQMQTGELVFDSNGGKVTVSVSLQVPVEPFPEGVLAGAASPRQLAEKARAVPEEAAPLIESGAVARWYKVNGWPYPVHGPTASGVGAVQQLFEALGLVKPPQVEISAERVYLSGQPGERIRTDLTVFTREKQAVVAHAKADQPWLHVGRTQFNGRSAVIPLEVPVVPHEPGQSLGCQLRVTANGNQRFVVPITLAIGKDDDRPEPVDSAFHAGAGEPAVAEPVPPPGLLFGRPGPWWPHLTPLVLLLAGLAVAAGHDFFFHDRGPQERPAGRP
jgi:hypothetical protein